MIFNGSTIQQAVELPVQVVDGLRHEGQQGDDTQRIAFERGALQPLRQRDLLRALQHPQRTREAVRRTCEIISGLVMASDHHLLQCCAIRVNQRTHHVPRNGTIAERKRVDSLVQLACFHREIERVPHVRPHY